MKDKNKNLSSREDERHKSLEQGSYRKFIVRTLVVLFVLFLGFWGVQKFSEWSFYGNVEQNVEEAREDWNNYLEERYEEIKNDTYGGETPYETLEMYIEAVENEDYELASKYFVIENQEEEFQSLNTSSVDNIKTSMNLMKQSLQSRGSYNYENTIFVVNEPVFLEFVKYPNNIWKIREI